MKMRLVERYSDHMVFPDSPFEVEVPASVRFQSTVRAMWDDKELIAPVGLGLGVLGVMMFLGLIFKDEWNNERNVYPYLMQKLQEHIDSRVIEMEAESNDS